MARRSGVQDFLTNFNMAYGLSKKVGQDIELGKIADAKAEEMQGFTTDDTAQLEAAAKSGQYDIGTKTRDDGTFEGYTVTPKADPTQTGIVAMQGVTDFMGNRTAGSMAPAQLQSAKERAMAGVIMKSDPVQGMRMMRDVTQGERDDQRWDRQTKQWGVEDADRAEKDADKAFSKNLEGEVGTWFKSRLSNPDGTAREATVDDHLAASQFKAAKLASAGKMDQAGQIMKDYNSQAYLKIQLETAQRNEALGTAAAALAAGDFGPVKDFYNRFTPDGAQVTNIGRGKDGSIVIERATDDGRPLPPSTMKDTGQILAALNTFKDPMALYNWSQNEFRNNLAIKADDRAERADGRAAAAAGRAAAADAEARNEKIARADTAEALFVENNQNATKAQRDAVRRGILEPVPTANKNATAEERLANAYMRAGLAKNEADALRMATQSKSDSPEKIRAELYGKALAASGSAEMARKATEEGMKYLYPEGAQPAASGRTASGSITDAKPVAKFNSAAEAEAMAKEGKLKAGNKVEINGRIATYRP